MQTYKKEFKSYLVRGLIFAYIGYCCGNLYTLLQGYDWYSKFYFLFQKGLLIENQEVIDILVKPTMAGLILALISFWVSLMTYAFDNDKGTYRHGEEHGSARYATREEMAKFSDGEPNNNIIFTRYARVGLFSHRLAYEVRKNKNIVCIGGPGSGKTFTFVKPNIMQMHSTYVTTDPKGLLVRETGQMLEDAGYKIKIINLDTLENSDTFNVFEYIKTELDVDRVLEAITEGTKKGDQKGEDFWNQAEALLIRSFIAFLWFDGQDNGYTPHLGMIADMLRFTERKDPKVPSPVEEWFEEQNRKRPNNYAYKQWSLFNDLYQSETRMSVLAIAAGRYSVFDHDDVVNMVRKDTMEIEKWNEEKTAVFIAIPETNNAYNFIASMLISTSIEVLRTKADTILNGIHPTVQASDLVHVRYLIDEFYNIGKLPNIDTALGTLRSREMSICMILQALDQLKTMYPKGWATLVATCDSLLFLGGNEEQTTKYLSQRAGKQTISIRKRSLSKGQRGGGSESRDKMARDLLDPSEIGLIGGSEALLFINGEHVFRDKKFTVSDHPNAPLLANSPQDDNWYYYKRYFTEADEWLDKVTRGNIADHGVVQDEAA